MTPELNAGERLQIVPCSQREAKAYVAEHHRHLRNPSRGAKFCVAVARGGEIVGVAMVGRPKAKALQGGWTVEATRVCTDGARNACSMLYGAAWRAARALGYRRLVTYTLPQEGGASLRAAGFKEIAKTKGGSWSRKARPRVDAHPLQGKLRWEVAA